MSFSHLPVLSFFVTFIIHQDDFTDLPPPPPPPPPPDVPAEPAYAEVKDLLPPQDDIATEEEEKVATGRFLASFSSSMGSSLLGDMTDVFANVGIAAGDFPLMFM